MRTHLTFLAFLAVVIGVPRVEAVTITTPGPNTISIPGLTVFETTGSMMDGLEVTATFTDGQETRSWVDTGPISGGVTGTNWGLSVEGDTYGANWVFANGRSDSRLLSLYLNGRTTFTVFDIASGVGVGQTPNSQSGWTWACTSGDCENAAVTYDWAVSIGAAAAEGDVWQTVFVDFSEDRPSRGFTFRQDTDNDARLVDPVPEPGTLALLGAGLAAARFVRRHR